MAISKSTRQVSTHASTRNGGARAVCVPDCEALIRFAETLQLRSLARATQDEYLRFVRKLAARHGGDPSGLDESQVGRKMGSGFSYYNRCVIGGGTGTVWRESCGPNVRNPL